MQPKHKLVIAIAGCGILLMGMLAASQVMHHISPSSSPYQATPIVTPVNAYRAGGHHTTLPASDVRDELALEAVKGEKEMWNAQRRVSTPQHAPQPSSYIGKTSAPAPITLPQRERGVRSVGGGRNVNEWANTHASTVSQQGDVIAQAHYTLPAMRNRQTITTSAISSPFSEEKPFEDLQLRIRPGNGSGTGTVVPIGDCPWVLFLVFPFILSLVSGKRRKKEIG